MNASTVSGRVANGGSGGGGSGSGTRWDCHLHKSANCEMGALPNVDVEALSVDGTGIERTSSSPTFASSSFASTSTSLFHIVPVKDTTQFAQRRYNARNETNEFWERLPPGAWYTPIRYSSTVNDLETFAMIMALFRDLDRESLSYGQANKPVDFLKQHIVTDGTGRVTLCNKHLLRQTVRKNGAKPRYATRAWIRGLLRALFPKLSTRGHASSNNVATNTPKWAIDLLHEHSVGGGAIDDGRRSLVDSLLEQPR